VDLPEHVLDYRSVFLDQEAMVTNTLPTDTSYGQRLYTNAAGFGIKMNVVLMGADRTSMHKPEFCLRGAGWQIDRSEQFQVPIERPFHYELPVVRKLLSVRATVDGQPTTVRGVFVYWFVADKVVRADETGLGRMLSRFKTLLTTGEMQRWAYVICTANCYPGQEDATFERLKAFIGAAVPDFQLATPAAPPAQAQSTAQSTGASGVSAR
jgi:hypothetical protein